MGIDIWVGQTTEPYIGDDEEKQQKDYVKHVYGSSYGAWGNRREELATALGFDLEECIGYSKHDGTGGWIEGTREIPPGPLQDLFEAPDNFGHWTPQQCKVMADPFRDLVRQVYLERNPELCQKLLGLAAGMQRCAQEERYLLIR